MTTRQKNIRFISFLIIKVGRDWDNKNVLYKSRNTPSKECSCGERKGHWRHNGFAVPRGTHIDRIAG
jgi:hypothetical protein